MSTLFNSLSLILFPFNSPLSLTCSSPDPFHYFGGCGASRRGLVYRRRLFGWRAPQPDWICSPAHRPARTGRRCTFAVRARSPADLSPTACSQRGGHSDRIQEYLGRRPVQPLVSCPVYSLAAALNASSSSLYNIATIGCFKHLHRNRKAFEQISYLRFISVRLSLRGRVDQ